MPTWRPKRETTPRCGDPGLDHPGRHWGKEVITKLRNYDPQIKAIVCSGYAADPIMADYEKYGFSGVVSKPYRIDELLAVLRQVAVDL